MQQYQAIVIGAGSAGTPLAKKLAKNGWKTALIEKAYIGGTCTNIGCTPTKTMIASAKTIYTVAQAKALGVNVDNYSVDLPKIIDRKKAVVERFRGSATSGVEQTENLALFYGVAAFTASNTISVKCNDGKEIALTADKIFIDTGTSTRIPAIEGLGEIDYFTSTTIMENETLPEHLVILGGSYIALEFGQMYRRFGSAVTIVEQAPEFLGKEDEDIAEAMKIILQTEDIKILLDTKITAVSKDDKQVKVTLAHAGKQSEITCSHILIAAGREPNTPLLKLEKAGVAVDDKGFIIVNEKLETNVPGIYALGDVKGGPAFTHIAYNDHLIVLNNLLEDANENIKGRPVPYTIFTDPQLGRIGITEKEAKAKGLAIKIASLPMSKVARAIETGDERGLMKAMVDADNGNILGAAIFGEEGGEVMSVLQMAMIGGITWQQLRYMIFAHPLYTESLNNLFMTLE